MSHSIKFQMPFEKIKIYEASPDVTLLKAIIIQAVIDATNDSRIRKIKKIAQDANHWIFEENCEFNEFCDKAGLEVSFIRQTAIKIIKLHKKTQAKLRIRSNEIKAGSQ